MKILRTLCLAFVLLCLGSSVYSQTIPCPDIALAFRLFTDPNGGNGWYEGEIQSIEQFLALDPANRVVRYSGNFPILI
jgi:hypothetical protein